ncbi:MAG: carboxylating nicotinate-nucleotide diphosphorylase [Anaerolineae bacterium]|nr:carboxylating nicotinate-nucleotide diphosphorylase [Anaerolineae bacterium]
MIIDNHTHTLIRMALEEDLGDRGDLTSLATLPPNSTITGRITAKAIGVIAGLAIVDAVYEVIDPTVKVTHAVKDGQAVEAGTLIAEVAGSSHAVLAGERIALNFLQRLSGVATLTAQFVQAVSETHTMILDTRKTTPGYRMLEKYAVKMGGGQNHRIGLHDMILIKDNHIDAAGGVTPAIQAALAYEIKAPIVVEVKNESELREALAFPITRILLDNMTTDQMRQAVAITAGRVPLEASGNMTLTRVKEVAHTGVNYISVGALTHSAPALDLSMRLSPIQR